MADVLSKIPLLIRPILNPTATFDSMKMGSRMRRWKGGEEINRIRGRVAIWRQAGIPASRARHADCWNTGRTQSARTSCYLVFLHFAGALIWLR